MINSDCLTNLRSRISDDNARDMYHRLAVIDDRIDFGNFKVCFDIGSRDLNESVSLATAFETADIYAFEASPDCISMCHNTYQVLTESIRNRIHLNPCAVNDVSGEISFFPLDTEKSRQSWGNYNYGVASKLKLIDGLNGTFLNEYWVQKEIKVQAVSLDDFCRNNEIAGPDLIWMDVQGAELDVLRGASSVLSHTKIIMTEAGIKPYYDGHSLYTDINEFLTSRGFVEIPEVRKVCHGFEFDVVYVNTAHYKPEYANRTVTI